MALNASAVNAHAVNAAAGSSSGEIITLPLRQRVQTHITLPLRQRVTALSVVLSLPLRQRVGIRGTVTLPLRQRAAHPSAVLTLPLRQRVGTSTPATDTTPAGVLTLPLRQRARATPAVLTGANTQRIEPVVLLAGVDVSARLTGPCEIDREESVAAVAEFTLQPFAGPVDLVTWLGAVVQIGVRIDGGAPQLLFTGSVSDPDYDPRTRLTTFRCTDRLQEILDNLPLPIVDQITGGYWSDAVFRSDATGWQRAQDRMSTQPAALDIAPAGGIRRTDWLAKATPDFAFDADSILDNTLRAEPGPWREQINRVNLTIELRYQRRLHRERTYRWVYPGGFHVYIVDSTTMPTEDDIRRAAQGAGWQVIYEDFVRFPPSGVYNGQGWVHNPDLPPFFVTEATVRAARRWTETVTETYQYTVAAPASIGRFGEQPRTEYIALSPDAPNILWSADTLPLRQPGDIVLSSDLTGAATAPNGDRYFDDLSPAEADNAILTALARAETSILAAHRGNSVEIATPLLPDVDLIHTARVETDTVAAQGKVRQVVHRLATSGEGESTTTVRLAVSQAADVAVTASPLAAPPRIATAPTGGTGPALGADDQTHLGGRWYSPQPQDPAWTGWVGNYADRDPWNAPLYDESFTIDWGAITREPTQATRALPHTVAIPHETLEIAA